MPKVILRVLGAADGTPTPHDGRYVTDWNPHTLFGILAVNSTADRDKATVFESHEAMERWKAISSIQKRRPDGRANRPLSALTVEFIPTPS